MIAQSALPLILRLDPGALAVVLGATTDLPPWANYGLLGALIVAILTRQFVPGWVHRDVVLERDALKQELGRMVDKVLTVSESAVPALRESTSVVNQAIEEIRLIRQRRR